MSDGNNMPLRKGIGKVLLRNSDTDGDDDGGRWRRGQCDFKLSVKGRPQ